MPEIKRSWSSVSVPDLAVDNLGRSKTGQPVSQLASRSATGAGRDAMDHWSSAGFVTELLPIIPPTGILADESAKTITLQNRGKIPGRWTPRGWTGLKGWADHRATLADVEDWSRWGANLGIQARQYPAIDVDVDDVDLSRAILTFMDDFFGSDLPIRHRFPDSARFLLMCRIAGNDGRLAKMRIKITRRVGDQASHFIELLAGRYQYVVEGQHPKGGHYKWVCRPNDPSDLPLLNADLFRRFLEVLSETLDRIGYDVDEDGSVGSGPGREKRRLPCRALQCGDDDVVIDAIKCWPENELSYDEWIRNMAAVKAAAVDPEVVYPAYEEWALGWPDNTYESIRYKWDSIASASVGWQHVQAFTREQSPDWRDDIEDMFRDVPDHLLDDARGEPKRPQTGTEMLERLGVFERYVYVGEVAAIWDTQKRRIIKPATFSAMLACGLLPNNKPSANAYNVFINHPKAKKVDVLGYRPKAPPYSTMHAVL